MASLFAPDGSYLGPLPCWLRIEPVPAYRFIQIHLPTHMPIPTEGGGLPENHVHLRTLNSRSVCTGTANGSFGWQTKNRSTPTRNMALEKERWR